MTKNDLLKPALESWQDLDRSLGEYALLENDLKRIKAKKNAQIQRMRAELEEETADLEARLRAVKQIMDIFVNYHLNEIRQAEKKSIELTNGTVKTQVQPVLVYPDDEYLVELLKKQKMFECIKVEEKPLKNVIRAKVQTDDSLMRKLKIEAEEETIISYKIT